MIKSKSKHGWFRYGVSASERYENFFKAIKYGGDIIVGYDTEYFVMKFGSADALPVWINKEEARAAIPSSEFPELNYVSLSPEEFLQKFEHLRNDEEAFIAVRPNRKGRSKTILIGDFIKLIT